MDIWTVLWMAGHSVASSEVRTVARLAVERVAKRALRTAREWVLWWVGQMVFATAEKLGNS
jgi:hypothetical protein